MELELKTRTEGAPPLQLRALANVEDLVIHGSATNHLAFSLTDDDLAGLAELVKLRQLEFFWCRDLTDSGLEHLKRLTWLNDLGINWCERTTAGGIAGLRTALPNCKITELKGGGAIGYNVRF